MTVGARTALILITAIVSMVLMPTHYYAKFKATVWGEEYGFPERIIEGNTGVLSIFPYPHHEYQLNGTAYTGGPVTNAWAEIGYAPELFTSRPIRRALVIGAGHGDQAMAFNSLPSDPQVDVAELSGELIAAQRDPSTSSPIGAAYFRGSYGMKVHVIDGRRWVNQALAEGIKYDVIQLGITMPRSGTSGNLYTKEMFEKLYRLLEDDGVLMVYSFRSALKSGLQVFPHAYFIEGVPFAFAFKGEVYLTKRPPTNPIWHDSIPTQMGQIGSERTKAVQGDELVSGGHNCIVPALRPEDKLSLLEVSREFAERFPENTDDNVVMTFDKLWMRRHPKESAPGSRIWLGTDIKPSDMKAIPVLRIPN